jgi:hypothetical protein
MNETCMDTMKSALAKNWGCRKLVHTASCSEKKDNIKKMYIGERKREILDSMEETEKEETERSDNTTKIYHSGTLPLRFHRLWLRQCFSLW